MMTILIEDKKQQLVSERIDIKEFRTKNGQVFLGDCFYVLRQLSENSIILAFTSPPYLNAINMMSKLNT